MCQRINSVSHTSFILISEVNGMSQLPNVVITVNGEVKNFISMLEICVNVFGVVKPRWDFNVQSMFIPFSHAR